MVFRNVFDLTRTDTRSSNIYVIYVGYTHAPIHKEREYIVVKSFQLPPRRVSADFAIVMFD